MVTPVEMGLVRSMTTETAPTTDNNDTTYYQAAGCILREEANNIMNSYRAATNKLMGELEVAKRTIAMIMGAKRIANDVMNNYQATNIKLVGELVEVKK